MEQYLKVLKKIIGEGVEKPGARENMPPTLGISHASIEMNMKDGFPLLTTKKVYWKGVVCELLWFLRGETNIKYLVDNDVNIWNQDAYRWYLKHLNDLKIKENSIPLEFKHLLTPLNFDDFISAIKNNNNEGLYLSKHYNLGDTGKIYGYQWRNQNGIDQVKEVLSSLKESPFSRYHIIDSWNKADFKEMTLPPCHLLYQFIVRPLSFLERVDLLKKETGEIEPVLEGLSSNKIKDLMDKYKIPSLYLDLNMYQRSCDTLLGVPFNIASMSLLLHIFAKTNNMVPGIATWLGGDVHLYLPHIGVVKEQLKRTPTKLPALKINKDLNSLDDILSLEINDLVINDYSYQSKLKGELFTGIK